jgi:gamma-glutamyltranspeptidase
VLHLKDEDQVEWLDRSRAESWTPRKLSTEIQAATAEPGKTAMRFWLVVECGTQNRMEKLAEKLTADGYTVKRQEKLSKVKVIKRKKKEPVTAKKKRSGDRPRNQKPKKA